MTNLLDGLVFLGPVSPQRLFQSISTLSNLVRRDYSKGIHAHLCTHTCTSACAHTHTYAHMHTHTHTHTPMHTHTRTNACRPPTHPTSCCALQILVSHLLQWWLTNWCAGHLKSTAASLWSESVDCWNFSLGLVGAGGGGGGWSGMYIQQFA